MSFVGLVILTLVSRLETVTADRYEVKIGSSWQPANVLFERNGDTVCKLLEIKDDRMKGISSLTVTRIPSDDHYKEDCVTGYVEYVPTTEGNDRRNAYGIAVSFPPKKKAYRSQKKPESSATTKALDMPEKCIPVKQIPFSTMTAVDMNVRFERKWGLENSFFPEKAEYVRGKYSDIEGTGWRTFRNGIPMPFGKDYEQHFQNNWSAGLPVFVKELKANQSYALICPWKDRESYVIELWELTSAATTWKIQNVSKGKKYTFRILFEIKLGSTFGTKQEPYFGKEWPPRGYNGDPQKAICARVEILSYTTTRKFNKLCDICRGSGLRSNPERFQEACWKCDGLGYM